MKTKPKNNKTFEVRSAIIEGVKVIRHASGKIEHHVPTSMSQQAYAEWKKSPALKQALALFNRPQTFGAISDATAQEAQAIAAEMVADAQMGELGALPYEDRTHEDIGLATKNL